MSATAWREEASCRNHEPFRWFSGRRVDIDYAKTVCFACPVRRDCLCSQLEYEAQIRQTTYGIFGGRLPEEREILLTRGGAGRLLAQGDG